MKISQLLPCTGALCMCVKSENEHTHAHKHTHNLGGTFKRGEWYQSQHLVRKIRAQIISLKGLSRNSILHGFTASSGLWIVKSLLVEHL